MKRLLCFSFSLSLLMAAPCFAQPHKTLTDYLALAKENSPLLNDFNNQRYSLKIDSLKMLANYGVQVTGNVDAMYAPIINNWGYDIALSNGQNVTAVVRVSKDLLGKENLKTRLSNYSLSIRQLFNQSKITEIALNKAITEQYIQTYALQQQYEVSSEIVKLLRDEETILKKLTQNSAFKQTDYLSFMVTLQQNILASQRQYADWLNNYATLNYLCGIVDTTLQKIDPPLTLVLQILPFEQSIYAENYKTDSLKLTNDAKIINYDYRPKLTTYVDGGYSSSFIATPYKNFGASIGLTLTVPIYDGNQRKKSLQQIQLQQDSRNKYFEFQKNQYKQQVIQLQNQIGQYRQMIETANEQMGYAQTLIDANLKQLPTGDVKVTDVIFSINNFISLKSELVQFETTIYNLYNQLNNLTIQ